jgi:hypothetical protein
MQYAACAAELKTNYNLFLTSREAAAREGYIRNPFS